MMPAQYGAWVALIMAAAALVCPSCAFLAQSSLVGRPGLRPIRHSCSVSMSAVPATPAPAQAANKETIIKAIQETPGAFMSLVEVKHLKTVTSHKIIVSKAQMQSLEEKTGKQIGIEKMLKYVVRFMQDKNMRLENTEGMIDAGVFPVNYFTVSQLQYFHNDVWDKLETMIATDVEV